MGQVGHALLTRSPLSPASKARRIPFDLHVLSTPPAFILSQNRTLHKKTMRKAKNRLSQNNCRSPNKERRLARKPRPPSTALADSPAGQSKAPHGSGDRTGNH